MPWCSVKESLRKHCVVGGCTSWYHLHGFAQALMVGPALANLTLCLLMAGSGRALWNNQLLGYSPRWARSVLNSFPVRQLHILLEPPDLTNLEAGTEVSETSAARQRLPAHLLLQTDASSSGSKTPAISQCSHNPNVMPSLLSPSIRVGSPKLSSQWRKTALGGLTLLTKSQSRPRAFFQMIVIEECGITQSFAC